MIYEYDFQDIGLDKDQQTLIDMGMGNTDSLNIKIREAINQKAKDGWEPLYPFSVPLLWFRRVQKRKKK